MWRGLGNSIGGVSSVDGTVLEPLGSGQDLGRQTLTGCSEVGT